MAEPYLICPSSWHRTTLEPDPKNEVIVRVESGGTPSTKVEEYWDGDVPWLTPKEITGFSDGLFVSRTERSITQLGLSGSAAKLMPSGTVMLSKRAPVGAVAVNAVPMATNQGFLNFRCGERMRPLYLAFWLRANKPYLDKVANGSTYPELYQNDLFEFEISVPPLELQDKILNALSALQFAALLGLPLEQSVTIPEQMVAMQAQNRRLSQIRDQILPFLLAGTFDVSSITAHVGRVAP
jgi:Type I restriction modification DNA specificity domain